MSNAITNERFLEGWKSQEYEGGLLVFEASLAEARSAQIEEDFKELTRQKREVAEQSGDNWHDGAFKATDEASSRLGKLLDELHKAQLWPVVELPAPESRIVSLGSRALLGLGRAKFYCDIVGMKALHQNAYDDHPEDVEVATLGSDIGRAILGLSADTEVRASIGGRHQAITIIEVMPSPDLQPR